MTFSMKSDQVVLFPVAGLRRAAGIEDRTDAASKGATTSGVAPRPLRYCESRKCAGCFDEECRDEHRVQGYVITVIAAINVRSKITGGLILLEGVEELDSKICNASQAL